MSFFNKIILFFIIVLLYSCSGNKKTEDLILEKDLDLQMIEAYKEGRKALDEGDAGKLIVIPNVGQDSVYSLPAPKVGLHFHIVGFGALAADGHDVSFHTNTLNTDFFHGAVVHHDTNQTGQTTSIVYGDGDSNDKIKLDTPQFFDINFLGKTASSWYVWGHSASDTIITIGD